MNKSKEVQPEKQENHPQSTLTLLMGWAKQHEQKKLIRLGGVLTSLILLTVLVLIVMYAINNFKGSWYSVYFFTQGGTLNWVPILFIGIDMLRPLFILALIILVILYRLVPSDSQIENSLLATFIKTVLFGTPTLVFLIGLQNLILYSFIGWKYISTNEIFEGAAIFLLLLACLLIIIGSRIKPNQKSTILEICFNLVLLTYPIMVIISFSVGGFQSSPIWFTISQILVNLFIFILGVDELKGRPTIFTYAVTAYHILQSGHASVEPLKRKSAETLAGALKVYKRLPVEQQEILAKWIIDNNEPSFLNRFWAIAKIILSTIFLTMFVQEPAIIFLKWFLKTVFGFSY